MNYYTTDKLIKILKEEPVLVLTEDVKEAIIKRLQTKQKGIEDYRKDINLLNRRNRKQKDQIQFLTNIIKTYRRRYNIDDEEILISELYYKISMRLYNCLMRAGFTTLNEVAEYIDNNKGIDRIRNLGEKTLSELFELLEVYKYYKKGEIRYE